MKILIAGGRGFMGSSLAKSLRLSGHDVWILTRDKPVRSRELHWDGITGEGWSETLSEIDAVVNATGYGLEHWPWTTGRKRRFLDSRVLPGRTLAAAIIECRRRPRVFAQISGINHYGLVASTVADESTPAAEDYLAKLTVEWEAATAIVETVGVRRVVARSAIVLDSRAGLFPLMALPTRLFAGGRLGDGNQAVPWIHMADQMQALGFLLENDDAQGTFNLVAPTPTSNEAFMTAVAKVLGRPYWLHTPAFLLRAVLGQMGDLVLKGRYSTPRRLLSMGYRFTFPTVEAALKNLVGSS